MVRACGEKYRGICCTENMESGSERLLKEGKTKTDVERSKHYY